MTKFLFTATLLLFISVALPAQTTITLTEDLVLTETWEFTESTIVVGNGFSISCENCNPMIAIGANVDVQFDNVKFRRGYTRWMRHMGANGTVSWTSPRMNGSSTWAGGNVEE